MTTGPFPKWWKSISTTRASQPWTPESHATVDFNATDLPWKWVTLYPSQKSTGPAVTATGWHPQGTGATHLPRQPQGPPFGVPVATAAPRPCAHLPTSKTAKKTRRDLRCATVEGKSWIGTAVNHRSMAVVETMLVDQG